jgi:hypothetical protein
VCELFSSSSSDVVGGSHSQLLLAAVVVQHVAHRRLQYCCSKLNSYHIHTNVTVVRDCGTRPLSTRALCAALRGSSRANQTYHHMRIACNCVQINEARGAHFAKMRELGGNAGAGELRHTYSRNCASGRTITVEATYFGLFTTAAPPAGSDSSSSLAGVPGSGSSNGTAGAAGVGSANGSTSSTTAAAAAPQLRSILVMERDVTEAIEKAAEAQALRAAAAEAEMTIAELTAQLEAAQTELSAAAAAAALHTSASTRSSAATAVGSYSGADSSEEQSTAELVNRGGSGGSDGGGDDVDNDVANTSAKKKKRSKTKRKSNSTSTAAAGAGAETASTATTAAGSAHSRQQLVLSGGVLDDAHLQQQQQQQPVRRLSQHQHALQSTGSAAGGFPSEAASTGSSWQPSRRKLSFPRHRFLVRYLGLNSDDVNAPMDCVVPELRHPLVVAAAQNNTFRMR